MLFLHLLRCFLSENIVKIALMDFLLLNFPCIPGMIPSFYMICRIPYFIYEFHFYIWVRDWLVILLSQKGFALRGFVCLIALLNQLNSVPYFSVFYRSLG